jgi:hypothetical protein
MARNPGVDWKRGNQALVPLKAALRQMPLSIAHDAARRAAPLLTQLTQLAFASGRGVYGEDRGFRYPSKSGKPLTLIDTGTTRDTLRFVANGTIVRCVLAKPYMKYLIGKYGVLPNGDLPDWWARKLRVIVDEAFARASAGADRRAA